MTESFRPEEVQAKLLRADKSLAAARSLLKDDFLWNARLRDAVTRLETFTKAVLNGENDVQVPVTATWVPLASGSEPLSMRNVVPRDRIELSTPAFSGLCSAN
jgi:hypothetical protein